MTVTQDQVVDGELERLRAELARAREELVQTRRTLF